MASFILLCGFSFSGEYSGKFNEVVFRLAKPCVLPKFKWEKKMEYIEKIKNESRNLSIGQCKHIAIDSSIADSLALHIEGTWHWLDWGKDSICTFSKKCPFQKISCDEMFNCYNFQNSQNSSEIFINGGIRSYYSKLKWLYDKKNNKLFFYYNFREKENRRCYDEYFLISIDKENMKLKLIKLSEPMKE